ncbi:hypothetical protein [Streptomyces sp. GC420]|uniref:hypothetical protein n=1 Tax=Streptomyces sp. GC420 TaxID=2697568 RepID=UPI001414F626|nr:hypothetical protein [Streptomyces sp. GC420]NBM17921.1 hypothetical protein [Streptomyces sp. GC420]
MTGISARRRAPDGRTSPAPVHADCVADSAGGLTFDVEDFGVTETWGAALVLRRRGHAGDEVRLPLTPAGEGALRAVLPSTMELGEGRWDAYADPGGAEDGAEAVRLAPRVNDLRSLVDRRPSGARGGVAVRIPYATRNGNLSVRSWLRAPHAEAGEIRLASGTMSLRGRLYGYSFGPGARAEARCRTEPGEARRAALAVEGEEFTLTLGFAPLTRAGLRKGERRPWDLWLRPGGDAGPEARLARLLDDVPDRKHIFVYPAQRLDTKHGPVSAGPYYTVDNDLSVLVEAL